MKIQLHIHKSAKSRHNTTYNSFFKQFIGYIHCHKRKHLHLNSQKLGQNYNFWAATRKYLEKTKFLCPENGQNLR